MKLTDLKTGDIPAIRTPNKLLSKGIRVFMWLWMLIRYRKINNGKLYNHTMIMLNNIHMAEAIGKGFVIRAFSNHYEHSLKNMVVFRLKEPLTEQEVISMKAKANQLASKNIEYEVLNFIYWIIYILSNGRKDPFPSQSKREDKVFCFEVSATLINAARPGFFPKPDHVNTVDLQHDERFETLYFDEPGINPQSPSL